MEDPYYWVYHWSGQSRLQFLPLLDFHMGIFYFSNIGQGRRKFEKFWVGQLHNKAFWSRRFLLLFQPKYEGSIALLPPIPTALIGRSSGLLLAVSLGSLSIDYSLQKTLTDLISRKTTAAAAALLQAGWLVGLSAGQLAFATRYLSY